MKGLSPISFSLSGSVSKLRDKDRTIGIAQMKFTLPIAAGISLPLSFSYASETETSSDSEFRVAIGGGLNADHLAALAKLLQAK